MIYALLPLLVLLGMSSSYSPISDEDTSGSTLFYRWQIANIANLSLGMSLDPARTWNW
jgi:hypothetical protein